MSERDNPTNGTAVSNGTDRPRVAFRGGKIAFMWASANSSAVVSPRLTAMRIFDVGPRPAGLDPVVPCSVENLGMKHIVKDTLVWYSASQNKAVIGNFVAMALGEPPPWVVYSPLPPLFLMLATGLSLFVLPYLPKRRAGM